MSVHIFFLGQLHSAWSYSIVGQLGWVNLFYEIMNEAILLPLFLFVAKVVKSGLLVTFCICTTFSLILSCLVKSLLNWMTVDGSIMDAAATYIRVESIANIFGMLSSFALVALVTLNREKYLYILTVARLVLSLALDTFLVSTPPVSLQLGVNGIGYSNLFINGMLFMVSLVMPAREGITFFNHSKMTFGWMKKFIKVGGLTGLESIVTNTVYYGGAFLLYRAGIRTSMLTSIALLFGFRIAFDSVVSLVAYCYLLKKEAIRI